MKRVILGNSGVITTGGMAHYIEDGRLPSGYRMLTGIVFGGGVFYDTGMRLQGSDTLKFSFEATKACNVLGCYTGANADDNYSLYLSTTSGAKYMRYNGGTYNSYFATNTRYDVTITPTGTEGFQQDSEWTEQTFTTASDMLIGTTSYGATSAKLTGTVYGNIEVVGKRIFVPAERIADGAIGYYDLYTEEFLENVGTGDPEILGYVSPYDAQIEYLESTGTQYIDTGYVPNENTIAVLDAALTSADDEITMFGLINSNGGVRFHFGTYQSKWHYGVSPRTATNKWYNFTTPTLDTARHTFEMRGNGYGAVDSTSNTISVVSGTYSLGVYLFGRNLGGGTPDGLCPMKYYGFTIHEGENLVHDFIPVRIGQVGYLYDSVSGELFGNNGTGSFVLGQDV